MITDFLQVVHPVCSQKQLIFAHYLLFIIPKHFHCTFICIQKNTILFLNKNSVFNIFKQPAVAHLAFGKRFFCFQSIGYISNNRIHHSFALIIYGSRKNFHIPDLTIS